MSYKLCEPAVEIIMIVKNNCSISLTRLSACFLSTFFLIKKVTKNQGFIPPATQNRRCG